MDKEKLKFYIKNILEKKIPVYFISPHLDDAALSSNEMITYLSKYTKVQVISIFTNCSPSVSLSAKQFVKQCGFTNSNELFKKRQTEDAAYYKRIKINQIQLGFVDCLYREKGKKNIFSQLLSKFIPETNLIYPTYKFHVSKGKINNEDLNLIDNIGIKLKELIKEDNAIIFSPLGLGNHIDHLITKNAIKKYFKNIIYYFDQPYYLRENNIDLNNYKLSYDIKASNKKNELLKLYKTQINALFKLNKIPPINEKYVFSDILNPNFPIIIDNYFFIQELIKKEAKITYKYGLYSDEKGNLAFAKQYNNKFKTIDFHFLKNEIYANQFLSKAENQFSLGKIFPNISFPKLITFKENKNNLITLNTFEEGSNLVKLPIEKKTEIIDATLSYFDKLNENKLDFKDSKLLKRGNTYFFLTLPIIFLLNCLRHPKLIPLFTSSLIFILSNFKSILFKNKFGFIHRDLGDKNIHLEKGKIAFFDFQLSCFSSIWLEYAVVYLKTLEDKKFNESIFENVIKKRINSKTDKKLFFTYCLYIALYETSALKTKDCKNTLAFIKNTLEKVKEVNIKSAEKKVKEQKRNKKLLKIVLSFIFIFIFIILLTSYIKGNVGPNGFSYQTQFGTNVGSPFEASSSTSRYALLLAMVQNHTFILDTNLARFGTPDVAFYKKHYFSLFTPGVSMLAIPFYILGNILKIPQLLTYSFILIVSVINVFLIAYIVKKLSGSIFAGILGGLSFLFGTNALSYALTFTQHQLSVLILLLCIINCFYKRSYIINIIFGILYGIGLLLDIPNGILLLPLLLYILFLHIDLKNDLKKIKIIISTKFIGLLFGLLPLLIVFAIYNHATTGSFIKLAQFVGGVTNFDASTQNKVVTPPSLKIPPGTLAPIGIGFVFRPRLQLGGFYTLLVSKERAWWYYSPIVFVGLLGFYSMYKDKNKNVISNILFSIIILNILLYSMFGDPWGGWAFGPRYLIPAAALMSIGTGYAIAKFFKNIPFLIISFILLIYSLWVNSLGALTTAAIPPKLAAESLGNTIPYTYQYNINLIHSNSSSSLIFNAYLHNLFNLNTFFYLLFILTILLFVILYVLLRKENN